MGSSLLAIWVTLVVRMDPASGSSPRVSSSVHPNSDSLLYKVVLTTGVSASIPVEQCHPMKGLIAMKHSALISTALAVTITGTLIVPAISQEDAKTMIATQVRAQQHPCATAENAARDEELSKPDSEVWILTCDNATYQVRLRPDMAAEIMKLN